MKNKKKSPKTQKGQSKLKNVKFKKQLKKRNGPVNQVTKLSINLEKTKQSREIKGLKNKGNEIGSNLAPDIADNNSVTIKENYHFNTNKKVIALNEKQMKNVSTKKLKKSKRHGKVEIDNPTTQCQCSNDSQSHKVIVNVTADFEESDKSLIDKQRNKLLKSFDQINDEVLCQFERNRNDNPKSKDQINKEKILKMLDTAKTFNMNISNKEQRKANVSNRDNFRSNTIIKNGMSLRQKMMETLHGARFRYINQQLYTSEGSEAKQMFREDPNMFKEYHDGFRQQVKKWPINPLDILAQELSKMPKTTKVADLGCGEAALAKSVKLQVRSFDLVSMDPLVEECDMAHTPLLAGEMDVAVFCLALMGKNLKDYLMEANRILKIGGLLKIAEVESRFENPTDFTKNVESFGFKLLKSDTSHNVFCFFDFKKKTDLRTKRNKLPDITLKPCLYKPR